ncbi:MAG: hypothetical protein O2960_20010, partial [Verrucomicrobia bacterium]|nr:hypothetical protein [Verrucomicrobiota bacterium]
PFTLAQSRFSAGIHPLEYTKSLIFTQSGNTVWVGYTFPSGEMLEIVFLAIVISILLIGVLLETQKNRLRQIKNDFRRIAEIPIPEFRNLSGSRKAFRQHLPTLRI